MERRTFLAALTASPLLSGPLGVHAQVPRLTIVVGSTAGGSTDTLARTTGQALGKQLNQPVVIENKPGGNGLISDGYVARSKPDGNTLLMAAMAFTVNPIRLEKMPYDPIKDFTPIATVARIPNLLIARKTAPFSTVAEFIAYARQNPKKINFAVAGIGSSIHIATEQFKVETGIQVLDVPYKGTSEAMTHILSGEVDVLFIGIASALPHVKAGTVKALGITTPDSIPQLPAVPPIAATVPGFQSSAWFGLLAPGGLDPARLAQLSQAVKASLKDDSFLKSLEAEAGRPGDDTPEEFARFIQSEIPRLRKLAQEARIQF